MTFRRSRIRSRGSAIAEIPEAGRIAAGSRRLSLAVAAVAVVLVLAAPAGGALEVRLSTSPIRPAALEPTQIVLRTYLPLLRADGSCCRLEPGGPRSYPFRVEAVSPTGKISRIAVRRTEKTVWRGAHSFSTAGLWQVRVANYGPSYGHAPGARPRISVRVGPARPTPAPAGFGPLGRRGCMPPSPADSSARGFRNVFGTAVGGEQLWALPFLPAGASWARPDAAVFDSLVGKEIKIVFAMTSVSTPFHAVGPGGTSLEPVWRRGHVGPTWVGIPGHEWGAGFVFPEAGCWRIRVGTRGDIWMLIRSS